MAKKYFIISALLLTSPASWAQRNAVFHVKSPDGQLDLTVQAGATLSWAVQHAGTPIITPSALSLTLAGGEVLGHNAVVAGAKTEAVNTTIASPVYKKSQVVDNYNQLTLTLKGNYGLVLRAYNDGVAYRFFTRRKGRLTVAREEATFNFAENYAALLPFVRDLRVPTDPYMSSFEALYTPNKLSQIKPDSLAFLPALVAVGNTTTYGGGMQICPAADAEDGWLDVTVIHPVNRLTMLRLLPQMNSGRFARHRCVEQLRARVVRVDGETGGGAPLVTFGDGEQVGLVPVDAVVAPQVLPLVVSAAR